MDSPRSSSNDSAMSEMALSSLSIHAGEHSSTNPTIDDEEVHVDSDPKIVIDWRYQDFSPSEVRPVFEDWQGPPFPSLQAAAVNAASELAHTLALRSNAGFMVKAAFYDGHPILLVMIDSIDPLPIPTSRTFDIHILEGTWSWTSQPSPNATNPSGSQSSPTTHTPRPATTLPPLFNANPRSGSILSLSPITGQTSAEFTLGAVLFEPDPSGAKAKKVFLLSAGHPFSCHHEALSIKPYTTTLSVTGAFPAQNRPGIAWPAARTQKQVLQQELKKREGVFDAQETTFNEMKAEQLRFLKLLLGDHSDQFLLKSKIGLEDGLDLNMINSCRRAYMSNQDSIVYYRRQIDHLAEMIHTLDQINQSQREIGQVVAAYLGPFPISPLSESNSDPSVSGSSASSVPSHLSDPDAPSTSSNTVGRHASLLEASSHIFLDVSLSVVTDLSKAQALIQERFGPPAFTHVAGEMKLGQNVFMLSDLGDQSQQRVEATLHGHEHGINMGPCQTQPDTGSLHVFQGLCIQGEHLAQPGTSGSMLYSRSRAKRVPVGLISGQWKAARSHVCVSLVLPMKPIIERLEFELKHKLEF